LRKFIDLVARAVHPDKQTDVEALEGGAMAVEAVFANSSPVPEFL